MEFLLIFFFLFLLFFPCAFNFVSVPRNYFDRALNEIRIPNACGTLCQPSIRVGVIVPLFLTFTSCHTVVLYVNVPQCNQKHSMLIELFGLTIALPFGYPSQFHRFKPNIFISIISIVKRLEKKKIHTHSRTSYLLYEINVIIFWFNGIFHSLWKIQCACHIFFFIHFPSQIYLNEFSNLQCRVSGRKIGIDASVSHRILFYDERRWFHSRFVHTEKKKIKTENTRTKRERWRVKKRKRERERDSVQIRNMYDAPITSSPINIWPDTAGPSEKPIQIQVQSIQTVCTYT